MNATRQKEAAERKAAQAQQEMNYDAAEEGRRKDLQVPTLAKAKTEAEVAQLTYVMDFYKQTANDLANSTTPEQVVARAERLKQQFTDPRLQARIDETVGELVSDPSQFETNRKKIILRTLSAKDHFAENHSDIFDAEGNLYNKKTSPVGAFPTEITPGVVTGPANTGAAPAPAPRTPVTPAPAGAPMRATQGSNTTPQDLMQQGMDPRNIPSGMPTVRPASFAGGRMATPTAGRMSPDMVPAILDSAVQTGVMAQIDLDQMLALAPPPARQGIMDVIRNNNISLQADAPSLAASGMAQQQPMAPNPVQRPQSQFADMRGPAPQSQTAGLDGAPPMQNTMAQYQVGQQIKGKNPNVSPLPGSAQVPIERVRAEGAARRPSAGEVYDTELAKIKAARAAGPAPATPKEKRIRQTEVAKAYSQTQSLIDKTYDPKEGAVALARKIKSLSSDQKEAITGFSGYIPSFRESSREADTLINNLKGVVTALGKDAAAASGAIGPMAVQEWKIVSDQIANLDLQGMTPRALDAQMDRIIQQVTNATRLAERVYDVQYGDDLKENPSFKLRGAPPPRAKTPVVKGGSRISPDVDKILKSRGL